jgi:hypothetical protein
VLRFTNEEVMKSLEGVVVTISQAAASAAPPSPARGEGAAHCRVKRIESHASFENAMARVQPRPTNGILVAITVMNITLASSGRLAM